MLKRALHHHNRIRLIKWGIFACTVVAVLAVAVLVLHLYARVGALESRQSADGSKDVLADAILSLNVAPSLDPTTGRRFIPTVKLVFPAASDSRRVYYRTGADESSVYLVDGFNQAQALAQMRAADSISDVYRQVGVVQTCSRQVAITFNNTKPEALGENEKVTQISTQKLKDGRTVTIYQNESCPYPASYLLETAKQLDSF